MNRRDFLKRPGVSGAAVACIPLAKEAEVEYISGELDPARAVTICADGLKAEPTAKEIRLMLKDALLQPSWIGIVVARDMVMNVVMSSKNAKFRADVLGSPEFRALIPAYRSILIRSNR